MLFKLTAAIALRQQMCNMADVANLTGFNIPPHMTIHPSGNVARENHKLGTAVAKDLIRGLPPGLSLHGLHDLSMEIENQRKRELKERGRDEGVNEKMRDDDRRSHPYNLNGHSSSNDDICQNSLPRLNASNLSITRLASPATSIRTSPDQNSMSPPAINLGISNQNLDLSFKSSRGNANIFPNDFSSLMTGGRPPRLGSAIKMEPLAECRD
jgi:hypothetical protein